MILRRIVGGDTTGPDAYIKAGVFHGGSFEKK